MANLARAHMQKMPLLRELKLNNSALSSVRDLGAKLRYLQVVSHTASHVSIAYSFSLLLAHSCKFCRCCGFHIAG